MEQLSDIRKPTGDQDNQGSDDGSQDKPVDIPATIGSLR
jgi:hypothetical protein